MKKSYIFSKETNMNVDDAAEAIRKASNKFGFIIRYDADMAKEFVAHDVKVEESLEYRTIMLCIPQKAHDSVVANSERAAVIAPKQISIYKNKEIGKTVVSHLVVGENFLKEILPNDLKIRESLPASCEKIVDLIKEVTINGKI